MNVRFSYVKESATPYHAVYKSVPNPIINMPWDNDLKPVQANTLRGLLEEVVSNLYQCPVQITSDFAETFPEHDQWIAATMISLLSRTNTLGSKIHAAQIMLSDD